MCGGDGHRESRGRGSRTAMAVSAVHTTPGLPDAALVCPSQTTGASPEGHTPVKPSVERSSTFMSSKSPLLCRLDTLPAGTTAHSQWFVTRGDGDKGEQRAEKPQASSRAVGPSEAPRGVTPWCVKGTCPQSTTFSIKVAQSSARVPGGASCEARAEAKASQPQRHRRTASSVERRGTRAGTRSWAAAGSGLAQLLGGLTGDVAPPAGGH